MDVLKEREREKVGNGSWSFLYRMVRYLSGILIDRGA